MKIGQKKIPPTLYNCYLRGLEGIGLSFKTLQIPKAQVLCLCMTKWIFWSFWMYKVQNGLKINQNSKITKDP